MKKLGLFIGIVYLVTYMMAGCVGEAENVSVLEAGREVAVDETTENIETEDTKGAKEDAMEEIVYSEHSSIGEPVEPLYAINGLPAMENQYYAEYDGNIYFRQYNAESFVEGELWADFGYSNAPMVEKQLLCMDSQGNISEVGKDWGFGPIYIMSVNENGPKMYSTLIDTDGMYKIYAYDIYTGNVEYLYSSEETIEILRCYDDKIAFEQGYYNLCCIDLGQSPVVQVDMGGYWKEEFLGMDERAVYYVGHQYSENADFYICESSYEGEEKVLAELEIIDIVPDDMRKEVLDEEGNLMYFATSYEITDVDCVDTKYYFILEGYAGTGHFPQGGALFELDTETGKFEKVSLMSNVIKFNIVEQNGNTWVYYPKDGFVNDEYKIWMECFLAKGDMNAAEPIGADARYDMGKITQNYYSHGGYDVFATSDTTGYSYMLLSEEEINSLGIGNPAVYGDTNGDVEWNLVRAEYIGDKLFFSVEISDHDIEQDVGWRYYYTRRMTYDYYKNLSTGEITLMQSY